MGEYLYGFDALTDDSKVRWQGVGAFLHYAPTKRLAFTPRFEWYADYQGYTSGTEQKLRETTLTGEYKFSDNFLSRFEYRRDWSNRFVFQRSDESLSKLQSTLLASLIFTFTRPPAANTASPTPAAHPTRENPDSFPSSQPAPLKSKSNDPNGMANGEDISRSPQVSGESTSPNQPDASLTSSKSRMNETRPQPRVTLAPLSNVAVSDTLPPD